MFRRAFVLTTLSGLAAACAPGGGGQISEPRPVMQRSYDLQRLRFSAREGLESSEANNFYPPVDIVWRGDPPGNRIDQIGAMFQEAGRRNAPVLDGTQPVIVDVVLVRFHGVTDRTRSTIGGVYNIIFEMTVRDARSGAVLEPARQVVGNLSAPGGARARAQDEAGQTQKVRVTDFLTGLLRQQLS